MKRLILVLVAFVGPFIIGACQEKIDWEIDVDIVAGNSESTEYDDSVEYEDIICFNEKRLSQGGDCWGDYFFQFVANNSMVRIYDLSLKTLVQTLKIPVSQRGFVRNCHCNTVCFGTEYYDAEDTFPLIYVSTGYAANGYSGALVYRITQHNGIFFITLVQTLKFPATESSWSAFVTGDEFAYLCYTPQRVIHKVRMPKLKDGDIVMGQSNALETYQFSPQTGWIATSRNQDRVSHQGKILVICKPPIKDDLII